MEFTITIQGTNTLLMHSARLSNPLDPAAKALKSVTKKRVKTDEDHEKIAELEHKGSLYLADDIGPFIPAQNIFRALVDGGKLTKSGVRVTRGVVVTSEQNPLIYDGPRNAAELWKDENFKHFASVKVGQARTMRCRPQFRQWSVRASGFVDTQVLTLDELRGIAESAGKMIGLGDWRPLFGRFTAQVEAA